MSHREQAVAIFRELGIRTGESRALNGLGEALLAAGRPGEALTRHGLALRLASQIGAEDQQARALNGLAHTLHATGQSAPARRRWQEALALYTGLGDPEAAQVQAQLAAMDGNGRSGTDRPGNGNAAGPGYSE